MKLIAVGKMKAGPERELLDRYRQRLRPSLDIVEVPQARGSPAEQKRREGDALLNACAPNAFVVALDEGGAQLSSLQLAERYQEWQASGRPLNFLIGGAEGLDSPVIQRADARLSLGKQTWPHMLVRVLLAEQLFRAQAIASGHPYHRAGRPD
ncbi:23S rRNA (pseudouridine(1915)-N(3))-methyltransferase RlmH [Oecophyllibacter saccharovorans]|uniref:Ribosomal RNA large subunit methyltransferase H n=1 Tax=Oecophyllibacter saccharovorans TaxID=2558360 RepID=A0A506UL02_9PROT|nr:23S rRNA (pseudouridine(1915)-N(3))-methyltransferase RlmH [Oecophyllibacter saccharovorans]TPW34044.1 23S rRNA (pseudouridine(1915)-N(3))-methyltransferase RlmH [Oecophyllibacter saccharovorans]